VARRLTIQRVILAVAGLVIVLGAACIWLAFGGVKPAVQATAEDRAGRQVREQRGRGAEVRYAEAGAGRALCGYAGMRGEAGVVAFVSRPNRILFSDDPLPVEFREMQQRFCPNFLVSPEPPS